MVWEWVSRGTRSRDGQRTWSPLVRRQHRTVRFEWIRGFYSYAVHRHWYTTHAWRKSEEEWKERKKEEKREMGVYLPNNSNAALGRGSKWYGWQLVEWVSQQERGTVATGTIDLWWDYVVRFCEWWKSYCPTGCSFLFWNNNIDMLTLCDMIKKGTSAHEWFDNVKSRMSSLITKGVLAFDSKRWQWSISEGLSSVVTGGSSFSFFSFQWCV